MTRSEGETGNGGIGRSDTNLATTTADVEAAATATPRTNYQRGYACGRTQSVERRRWR